MNKLMLLAGIGTAIGIAISQLMTQPVAVQDDAYPAPPPISYPAPELTATPTPAPVDARLPSDG